MTAAKTAPGNNNLLLFAGLAAAAAILYTGTKNTTNTENTDLFGAGSTAGTIYPAETGQADTGLGNLLNLDSLFPSFTPSFFEESSSTPETTTKKAAKINPQATSWNNLTYSAISQATLTDMTDESRQRFNSGLYSSILKEDRTGGGSVSTAYEFMSIPTKKGQKTGTVDNFGINNAGHELKLTVNPDGSYQLTDWKRNTVGSGSAGAYEGITTTKKAANSGSSGSTEKGGSTSSSTVKTSGGNTYDRSTNTTTTRTGETSSGWVSH